MTSVSFVPVKGGREIWEASASTEAGAAQNLIEYLNTPQVRSWKQLMAAGYKIKRVEMAGAPEGRLPLPGVEWLHKLADKFEAQHRLDNSPAGED